MLLLLSGGDEVVTATPTKPHRLDFPIAKAPPVIPEDDDAVVLVAILRHRFRL